MKLTKDEIVTLAREIYAKKYHDVEPWKGCVYWAAAFDQAAKNFGIDDTLIQAGSAQFQFRKDNGSHNTHFSYMYDQAEAMYRLKQGLLPEVHVWNAVRSFDWAGEWQVVDLTTRYQAKQAKDLQGLIWEPDFTLPDYYWGQPDSERMIYRADASATLCMLMHLKQIQGFWEIKK